MDTIAMIASVIVGTVIGQILATMIALGIVSYRQSIGKRSPVLLEKLAHSATNIH